jgi:predicted secreted protein
MATKLGLDAKIYQGTAGSTATTEMSNVTDVTLNLSKSEADVTTRANAGWKATIGTLKEGSVSFTMLWDTEDAGFAAIQQSWFDNTAIALLVLDSEDGTGLDADFSVISFTRNEPLSEAISVSVECKPTSGTRAPAWVTAS